ncbi:HD domain-containing phosphohydrolase [Marinicrinis sediminis]|uniref:HD domain-containing phosphohydrolase n=1 Tax=Marinicrinis sediminis TaxID=1652465 RepID=A0ABW5R8H2_9BACL
MIHYHSFVRQVVKNYLVGSSIAVILLGGAFIFFSARIAASEFIYLFFLMMISCTVMVTMELWFFRKHLKPIKDVFVQSNPSWQQLKEAYVHIHRMPLLSIFRIFGPHFLGMSIPAFSLSALLIYFDRLNIPYSYLAFAFGGAVLIAAMHALVEFYLTTRSIRPLIQQVRILGVHEHQQELTLEGKVLVSMEKKFQLGAFLVGTIPLLLFSLAVQFRLADMGISTAATFWMWTLLMLIIGITFSFFGSWLLTRDVQHPIGQLYHAMKQVQDGNLEQKVPDLYSDEFSRLVTGFNHMVDSIKDRNLQNQQLVESYISTLAAALDARDRYTAGHSQRVAQFSVMIGHMQRMSDMQIERLKRSALLHDIGKIGIRDSVLLKDGKLTEEEYEQIKLHPALGEDILKQVHPQEAMADLLPGVRSHHERYDGFGYPDGLKGEDIPLFGRIIAIADAFDAMTSDRPYRKGMSMQRALDIIEQGSGTQWDPVFAPRFVQEMRKKLEEQSFVL